MTLTAQGKTRVLALLTMITMGIGLASAPLRAQSDSEAQDAAKRFGVRPSVLDISLSPSGNKIAWISSGPGHTEVLNIVDLSGSAERVRIAGNNEIKADLETCEWATDERLVCQVYGQGQRPDGVIIGWSRAFSVSDDGKESTSLTQRRSSRALRFNQFGGTILALDVAGGQRSVFAGARSWHRLIQCRQL